MEGSMGLAEDSRRRKRITKRRRHTRPLNHDQLRRLSEDAMASAMEEIDSVEERRNFIYGLIHDMEDLQTFIRNDNRTGLGYIFNMQLYTSLGDSIRLLNAYKNNYERLLYGTQLPLFERNLVSNTRYDGQLPNTPSRVYQPGQYINPGIIPGYGEREDEDSD